MSKKNTACFSVNMLCWNRRDTVLETLSKVFQLTEAGFTFDVVFVDNGSTDGTADAVRQRFPSVKVIALEKNVGVSGWNFGVPHCSTPNIFFLDDDAYLDGESIIAMLEVASVNDKVGVVASRVINPTTGKDFTATYPTGVMSFWGCCALIKREAFERAGGFSPAIFLYGHELDFIIGMKRCGYEVAYLPNHVNYHLEAGGNRSSLRACYHGLRSINYIIGRRFTGVRMIMALLNRLIALVYFSVLYPRSFFSFVRVFFEGIRVGLKDKQPVSLAMQNDYLSNHVELNCLRKIIGRQRFFLERKDKYPVSTDGAEPRQAVVIG